MNFNQAELEDMAQDYIESHNSASNLLVIGHDEDDGIKDQVSELKLIEWYALDNGLIDSEEALSERFDELINDLLETMKYHDAQTMLKDRPLMNEQFSNFMDAEEQSGQLHAEQVATYEYVGEHG